MKTIFDAKYYAECNPDVVAKLGNSPKALFNHFCNYGLKEGRMMNPNFNPDAYASAYSDLSYAFGGDVLSYYRHFVMFGIKENRVLTTIERCNIAGIVVYPVSAHRVGVRGVVSGSIPVYASIAQNTDEATTTELEAGLASIPDSESESRPEIGPEVTPEPESRPEIGPEVTPEPESRPEIGPEVTPKPESRPEIGPEVTPEPESRPEIGPEVTPEPEPEPEPIIALTYIDEAGEHVVTWDDLLSNGNEAGVGYTKPYIKVSNGKITDIGNISSDANLILTDNITEIAEAAFSGCTLNSLTICGNITIAENSFKNADIKELSITDGDVSIMEEAFSGCTLDSLILSGNITISRDGFKDAEINELSIADGSTLIEDNAFANADIKKMSIDGTQVAGHAFSGAEIGTLEMGNDITLEKDSFSNVTIEKIIIDTDTNLFGVFAWLDSSIDEMTTKPGVTAIKEKQVSGLPVKKVDLPAEVTSLGVGSFENCKKLEEVVINGAITSIPATCFRDSNKLDSLKLPASLEKIEVEAFGCWRTDKNDMPLSAVYFEGTMEQWQNINIDLGEYYGHSNYTNNENLKNAPIHCSDGVLNERIPIGEGGLDKDGDEIIDISWSELVENGTKYTREYAMQNSIPFVLVDKYNTRVEVITNMGQDAELYIPEGFESLGIGNSYSPVLGASTEDTTVNLTLHIPRSVNKINDYAFKSNVNTPTVIFKFDNRTNEDEIIIGSGAFADNLKITDDTFSFPVGLKEIQGSAFANTGFISVTIPDTVTTLGRSVFSECKNLESVTIPSSVESIAGSLFYNCRKLNNVVIPNSVKSIERYAFNQCYSLTKIFIPGSVESINQYAFSNFYNPEEEEEKNVEVHFGGTSEEWARLCDRVYNLDKATVYVNCSDIDDEHEVYSMPEAVEASMTSYIMLSLTQSDQKDDTLDSDDEEKILADKNQEQALEKDDIKETLKDDSLEKDDTEETLKDDSLEKTSEDDSKEESSEDGDSLEI